MMTRGNKGENIATSKAPEQGPDFYREGVGAFLDAKVKLYNQPGFIEKDPVSIPHSFTQKQDIEISGLFAAVLAWGNRTTIIPSVPRSI